jgi:hypothetical protein
MSNWHFPDASLEVHPETRKTPVSGLYRRRPAGKCLLWDTSYNLSMNVIYLKIKLLLQSWSAGGTPALQIVNELVPIFHTFSLPAATKPGFPDASLVSGLVNRQSHTWHARAVENPVH